VGALFIVFLILCVVLAVARSDGSAAYADSEIPSDATARIC